MPTHTCTCKKCGYSWNAAVPVPKACPRCKSYVWNKPYKRKPLKVAA